MLTTLNSLKKMMRWVFPPVCILCLQPSDRTEDLCQSCLAKLPILPQTCPRCAKTFSTRPEVICGDCLKNPPPFDAAYALFSYQKPITKLIMELKFHERLINAEGLGRLMLAAIQQRWYVNKPLPDLIIPMPLHRERLKERGFNQALEIARPIAKKLKIAINFTSCLRVKPTLAQATLPANKRSQNIKNAFLVRQDFSGYHLAILDDVTTTGHSIHELAKTLKKAGSPRIDVWFCARTPLDDF